MQWTTSSFKDLIFLHYLRHQMHQEILTSQTSQYSNTAVTGHPAANPKSWSSLDKLFLWGVQRGSREGGRHTSIIVLTPLHNQNNVTHAMQFKVNVIPRQTHDVCPISGGAKCVNGKVRMKNGRTSCAVVNGRALLTSAGAV